MEEKNGTERTMCVKENIMQGGDEISTGEADKFS